MADTTQSKPLVNKDPLSKDEKSEREAILPLISIYRKRAFRERESLMDRIFAPPTKENPNLHGFHNLFVLLLILFAGTHPILHYIYKSEFFNLRLFYRFEQDFFSVLFAWPVFTLWCYTAFAIQKLVIMGMPIWLMYFLQHITQTFMFLITSYVIMLNNWDFTHTIFLTFQCCIHFMKMHSYTMTNLLLREEWHESKKRGWKQLSPYPDNVNLKDFTYYLTAPVLVYWYEYPRTQKIRWLFLLERSFFTILGLLALYLIAAEIFIPVFDLGKQINFIQALWILMIPSFLFALIGFFTIWDCILNCFAEITRFADREFYQDWWNCENYDTFNRKWNKIVHEFLFRHVYSESIHRWHLSPSAAYYFTFFFSGLLHEYLAAILFRKVKPFFLILIMAQLPYTVMMTKIMKNYTLRFRNFTFWIGLSFGLPLIILVYSAENFS